MMHEVDRIIVAARRAYVAAEAMDIGGTGVAPLDALIGAFPIRAAELGELTFSTARTFLERETGQQVPLPKSRANHRLAGFLYVYAFAGNAYGCILVERNDPVARRRFSAAHELGHYLLHFLPLLESAACGAGCVLAEGLGTPEENPDENPPIGRLEVLGSDFRILASQHVLEDEANRFAAELLMPAESVRRLCGTLSQGSSDRQFLARRLAPEFLVSRQAMARRMEDLHLPAGAGPTEVLYEPR